MTDDSVRRALYKEGYRYQHVNDLKRGDRIAVEHPVGDGVTQGMYVDGVRHGDDQLMVVIDAGDHERVLVTDVFILQLREE